MNIIKLAAAAALALSSLAMASAPAAAAQRGDRWEQSDNGRHNARSDRGRRDGWRNNRGNRNGWRNNRGRHNGWRQGRRHHASRYRSCRTVWRYGHRQRVCGWRYR